MNTANSIHSRLFCLAMVSGVCLASAPGRLLGQDDQATTKIPEVVLSEQHAKLVRVRAGDPLPSLSLPTAVAPDSEPTPLTELYGAQATVVLFWKGDGYMAKTALRDLAVDVVEPLAQRGVRVAAVAVETPPRVASELTAALGYDGPVLLDADGSAFWQVGSQRLPQIFVLDAQGQIAWFDIEYSQATRRELRQTLSVLAPRPARK